MFYLIDWSLSAPGMAFPVQSFIILLIGVCLCVCLFQVVTVTTFIGGDAFNVIPETVTLGGTFRALSSESFAVLKKRIQEVCNLLSLSYGQGCMVQ